MIVDLPGDYPLIWEKFANSLPNHHTWNPTTFANFMMACYQIEVVVNQYMYKHGWFWIEVDEHDWTMFLLKWDDK